MRSIMTGFVFALCTAVGLAGFGGSAAAAMSAKDKARADVQKASKTTLDQLHKAIASSRKVIADAAGYATFSNFGMRILVAGSGSGKGFGVKKFRVIWVFADTASLDKFINAGWETGAQAAAAAKTGDKGNAYQGAASVSRGVCV
jgi:hypothetical protein